MRNYNLKTNIGRKFNHTVEKVGTRIRVRIPGTGCYSFYKRFFPAMAQKEMEGQLIRL